MAELYDRQEELELNTDQSITVVGCGGIGFNLIKFAAMSGIEKIYAFDDDVLEKHNLNRIDLPSKFVGVNKADAIKTVINSLRPDCSIYTFPYKFSSVHQTDTDWLIDCTDNIKSQIENQKLAKSMGMRYMKVGYDGEEFSIHDSVAEWGEAPDGYQIIPSWVVPASVIAAIAVAKILKYNNSEVVGNVLGLFGSYRKGNNGKKK
jgi:hypothetical protein